MFDAIPASTAMAPIITNRKMSLMEYTRTRGKKKARLNDHIEGHDIVTMSCSNDANNKDLGHSYNQISNVARGNNVLSQLSLSQSSLGSVTRSQTEPLSLALSMKDSSCLPAPRSRSRACVMCSGKGHGKNKCPKLILYGAMPLPDGVLNVRQTLSNNLMDVDHFKTFTRDDFDNREIMKSFPKFRLPALIIHKRYIIQENLVKKKVSSNLCLECTFLLTGGEEDFRYTKILFRAQDVAAYVQKTVSNTVVSLLHLL